MIYHVTARFREETACLFRNQLTNGQVAAQQPDGPEIVASMHRAVVMENRRIAWTETCFCRIPLAHERKTVLDLYFEDIIATEAPYHISLAGLPFMEHLKALCQEK